MQSVVAVGIVQAPPYLGTTDDRWGVVVALHPEATELLSKSKPKVRVIQAAAWKATDAEVSDLLAVTGPLL